MKDDCISRQAAIETINIHLNETDVPASYPGIITALEKWLNNLPSAQPEPCEDGDELEEAIRRLESLSEYQRAEAELWDHSFDDYSGVKRDEYLKWSDEHRQLASWLRELKRLRTQEPCNDIVECKDCKHRGEKPISDGRYWCNIHNSFMYYCSDAERRTDDHKQ